MSLYKQYVFKCMYLQKHIENMVNAGYIAINNIELDALDNEDLIITITSDGICEGAMFVVITKKDTEESILGYQDRGETVKFLKGLGRLNTAAYIASCLKDGQQLNITDKTGIKYGIARINIMDNRYIVTGGFENPTGFLNINGLKGKEVTNLVMNRLISDDQDFCSFDPKTISIIIETSVALASGASIYSKPYVEVI